VLIICGSNERKQAPELAQHADFKGIMAQHPDISFNECLFFA